MDTTEEQEVLGSDQAGDMRAVGCEARVDGRTRRRKFSEETWRLAEADYFGGTPAKEVCAKYGMSLQTLYLRVGGRGKRARASARRRAPAQHEGGAESRTLIPAAQESDPRLEGGGEGRRFLVFLAYFFLSAARWITALLGTDVETLTGADGRIRTRRHHTKEAWAAARKDYERGATAPQVAGRYHMTAHAVKKRAHKEKWSKTVKVDAAPLVEPVDPAQVEVGADGKEASIWEKIAHDAQRPPEGAWSTWLFQGGRGAGKTRAGAEWLAQLAEATPHGRFALIGPTLHDVREVMIEGPSGLRRLPGRELPQYESSRRLLKWRNGATAQVFSAEEPERLRGPQFMAAWADEFCVWPKPEAVLANLRLAMRMGNDPRLVVTTTPRPIAALRRLKAEVSCVTTQAATAVNAANLAETFLSGLELLYGGTRLAEQELGGVLVEGDGALWKAEDIARARGAAPAEFSRVVVGVDPPASADGVCGIVVAGRAGTHGYVLEDVSGAGLSPFAWANRVADAARRWGARAVIAEANQGGDMVRSNLASADVKCPIRLVHASKGKRTRAEPVAALYEQRKVTHCGAFPLLEEEMMAIGGGDESGGEGRVDRADALVWALTALMLEPQPVRPSIEVL